MVIFQISLRTMNRIGQWAARSLGTICADSAGRSARPGDAVEEERSFLLRPAVICTLYDAIDFLNRVLPHITFDQIVRPAAIEGKAIRITQPDRINLRHRAPGERIVGRNSILAIAANRISAQWLER